MRLLRRRCAPPRNDVVILFLAAWLLAAAPAAMARSEMEFIQGADKTVSIDLRDSDVVDVLKFLSQKGKFNIFISPKVSGRVTLALENVKIADILDFILLSNGLAFRNRGSIVYVMPQDEYRTRYGRDYSDEREVKMSRLQFSVPSQIFKMLEPTKSSVGNIVVDEQTGTVILMDLPEKIEFMTKIIAEMDQPLQTRTFDLSYAKAKDVQALITAQVDLKGVASVSADERSNQLIVTAFPNRLDEIEKVVTKLDRKTREVAIDTQIVKIILSDDKTEGIEWRKIFQEGFLEPLDFQFSFPKTLTSFGSITYSTFGPDGFEIFMNYVQTLGESKILASPRLTVVEGEEAKILIGTREAYLTTTTTVGSGGVPTVAEAVSFIDVGISLTVTPQINKEGYVNLKIKPEVSSVVDTLPTPSGNEIPIVDTTQVQTRVMVKDGTTIVIGGLRKEEKTSTKNRIPFLADIPLVGGLFQDKSVNLDQTELVVFLTPRIIEGDQNATFDAELPVKGMQAYPSALTAPQPPSLVRSGGNPAQVTSASLGTGSVMVDPKTGKIIAPS